MAGKRRSENAALVVPIFGALLMVPPLLSVFNIPFRLFGVPLIALYLFVIWVGMIGATVLLARKTPDQPNDSTTSVEDD